MYRYRPLVTGPIGTTVSAIRPSRYVHGATVERDRTSRTGLNR
jgi:hypothetical protein